MRRRSESPEVASDESRSDTTCYVRDRGSQSIGDGSRILCFGRPRQQYDRSVPRGATYVGAPFVGGSGQYELQCVTQLPTASRYGFRVSRQTLGQGRDPIFRSSAAVRLNDRTKCDGTFQFSVSHRLPAKQTFSFVAGARNSSLFVLQEGGGLFLVPEMRVRQGTFDRVRPPIGFKLHFQSQELCSALSFADARESRKGDFAEGRESATATGPGAIATVSLNGQTSARSPLDPSIHPISRRCVPQTLQTACPFAPDLRLPDTSVQSLV